MEDIKIKLSNAALTWLASKNVNPFLYHSLDDLPGIHLRNFGPDVTIPSRTKYLAFQSGVSNIDTGISLSMPAGVLGIIVPTETFAETSLINKSHFIFGPGAHCRPKLINYGESDIVIPHGSELPLRLIFSTQLHDHSVSQDEDYVEKAKKIINSTIQKREI